MEGYTTITNTAGELVGGAMPPQMEGIPPHWNVYFNVSDADATGVQVAELGGTVIAPIFDVPGVGRMGVFADPQGGMFNVMQAPNEG
jgi:predicted enzyme related to lactoylglutathione lyase